MKRDYSLVIAGFFFGAIELLVAVACVAMALDRSGFWRGVWLVVAAFGLAAFLVIAGTTVHDWRRGL